MKEFIIKTLEKQLEKYASAPTLSQMDRRELKDKGIAGPTAAHTIEEIHVPKNYAYVTFTTGSSAFQNPVGITWEELEDRKEAGKEVLRRIEAGEGSRMLVTYAPLVNVFCGQGLQEAGIETGFLKRSCREALLLAWCGQEWDITIGESSFLRTALEDAVRMGLKEYLPKRMILLAAGTPLDDELPEMIGGMDGWELHDLYGCQEFGWLALDGVPLREDLVLLNPESQPQSIYPVVGGIPVGDAFRKGHHRLNPQGVLVTHAPAENSLEWETWVLETTARDGGTARRASKSILRTKARVVRCVPDIKCGQEKTKLCIRTVDGTEKFYLDESMQTKFFDSMLEAQKAYQQNQKRDDTWIKKR